MTKVPEGTESINTEVQALVAEFSLRAGEVNASFPQHYVLKDDFEGIPLYALARIMWNTYPDMEFVVSCGESPRNRDCIDIVFGARNINGELKNYTWVEVRSGNDATIIFSNPSDNAKYGKFTCVTSRIGEVKSLYERTGLVRLDLEELEENNLIERYDWVERRPYYGIRPELVKYMLEIVNDRSSVPIGTFFDLWWRRYQEKYSFFVVSPLIEKCIEAIPVVDRHAAVDLAIQVRRSFLLERYKIEWQDLDPGLKEKYNLRSGEDWEEWKRYLRMAYELDWNKYRLGDLDYPLRYSLWEAEFVALLLKDQMVAEGHRFEKSFIERHLEKRILDRRFRRVVMPVEIGGQDLVAHSISETGLALAVQSGMVGSGGVAHLSMSLNRVVEGNRDLVIVWRAREILAAGYYLFFPGEDMRDSLVLNEVVSGVPLPLSLAVRVAHLSEIPDRDYARGPVIHRAGQFCGTRSIGGNPSWLDQLKKEMGIL